MEMVPNYQKSEDTMSFLNQLWGDEQMPEKDDLDYRPEMPESGEFTNSFTGPWASGLVYRTWVEDGINLDTLRLPYDARQVLAAGSGAFYFWHNTREGFQKATAACEELGKKYGPNLTWRWEMPMAEILGWTSEKNPVETFGETRSAEVDIAPLTSKRNRHKYQMIVLPSALQALAIGEGLLQEPIYDYAGELSKLRSKLEAGVSLHDDMERLIGNEKEFANSELWKARVRLWKVFGEESPQTYTVGQGKHDVTSELMKQAMGIVYHPQKFWASLVEAPDPHVDAVTKSGKHTNVFIVHELFASREAAVAKVGESTVASNGAGYSNGAVKLPVEWANIPGATAEDWLGTVREIASKFELRGKNNDEVMRDLVAQTETLKSTYFCEPQDVAAAMAHI